MRQKKLIKKIILFGTIGVLSFSGSVNTSNTAQAAITKEKETAVTTDSNSTESVETLNLYPVKVQVDGEFRYGYIDSTGEMILQPMYMSATNYSEGFAVVSNGEKNQVINQEGTVVFESEGTIQEFHHGFAVFNDPKNNYNDGYINTSGKVVIKPQFYNAGKFDEDQTAIVMKSEKLCRIDSKGKVIKTYKSDSKYYYFSVVEDGYVIINDKNTFKRGVMSLDGKMILKPIYSEINYLGNGLFGVKKAKEEEQYLLEAKPSAIFNNEGKQLTSYQYYDLSKFSGDYATVTDSKSTYFIDKSGKKVDSLPVIKGRGDAEVIGDIVYANIDGETIVMKKDGTLIWENDGITQLSSGITVSTVKFNPNKLVVVNYPKIDGLSSTEVQKKVNQKLKSIFTKYRAKIDEKEYLTVLDTFKVKQIKDLIMINRTGYDYPIGAAHGLPVFDYYFIDSKTGTFYQFKDLFKKGSDYVTPISKIIMKQMKKDANNDYYFDSKVQISKDQLFYLGKDKLTIYFGYGTIAANAAGFPEFEISWKDVKNVINTEGAFWKSFNE